MDKIEVKLIESETTTGKIMYGGRVYLNNKQIKFIPIMDIRKTKMEKYLGFLRKNLKVEHVDLYTYVRYVDDSGKSCDYWDNVPRVG